MGITIHYRFLRKQEPTELLKNVEQIGLKLGFKVESKNKNSIVFNPHKNSEWIDLTFESVKDIRAKNEGWNYNQSTLKEFNNPNDCEFYCSGFCKTQYAGIETHIKVAEFLRVIASFCSESIIYDEGDYYESQNLEQAIKSFDSSSKMISNLLGVLKGMAKDNSDIKIISSIDKEESEL